MNLKRTIQRSFLYRPLSHARDVVIPERRDLSRRMRSFYSQFVAPGDLVFDVGANVGNRVEVFSHLGARVIAVEPQPMCARVLRSIRGDITIEEMALGAREGSAKLHVSSSHVLSSMAPGWIDAVRSSGRFTGADWEEEITVAVSTLDGLVTKHGLPAFCKIDVEGFEVQVLEGLTRPLPAISFEFTVPEYASAAIACVERLSALGDYRFNVSLEESMEWHLDAWVPASGVAIVLRDLPSGRVFGDIYAMLTTERLERPSG